MDVLVPKTRMDVYQPASDNHAFVHKLGVEKFCVIGIVCDVERNRWKRTAFSNELRVGSPNCVSMCFKSKKARLWPGHVSSSIEKHIM